jgi:hypothetical protein
MVRLLLFVAALLVSLLPVKIAAIIVHARRTGFFWCFIATLVAGMFHMVAMSIPGPGIVLSFLLAGAGYAVILRTSYASGLVITVLQFIIAVGLSFLVTALFGFPGLIQKPLPIVL